MIEQGMAGDNGGSVALKNATMKRRLAVLLLGSTILCCGALLSSPQAYAQTQQAGQAMPFSIPAQALSAAVDAFSRATGWQVGYSSQLARSIRTRPVSGTMTPAQALETMLAGTGVHISTTGPTSAALVSRAQVSDGAVGEDGSLVLDPITVQGQQEGPFGLENGFIAERARTTSKIDLPIVETPFDVSVVTRKQLDTLKPQTTKQIFNYSPGVIVGASSIDRRDETGGILVRGFTARPLFDGLRIGSSGFMSKSVIDPYLLERAEIFSGPASFVAGDTPPGGTVGFISKRPTKDPVREVSIGTGSYGRLHGAFDFGGSIDDDGHFLYRLTAVGLNSGTQVDDVKDRRIAVAPAFTWNPTEDTRLTLLGSYHYDPAKSSQTNLPLIGTLLPSVRGYIPTDFYGGETYVDTFSKEQVLLGYELEHRFNETFSFRQNLKYNNIKGENYYIYTWQWTDGAQEKLSRDFYATKEKLWSISIDNQLKMKFNTWSAEHSVIVGLDHVHSDSFRKWATGTGNPISPWNPQYGAYNFYGVSYKTSADSNFERTGIYLQDVVSVDKWRLIGGVRKDWADTYSVRHTTGVVSEQKDDAVTWRAGAAYVFDSGITPYANYATSFEPLAGTNIYGETFTPMTGEQFEVGVKYQPPGMESFVQLSAFDVAYQNYPVSDPGMPGNTVQIGEVRLRGVTPSITVSLPNKLNFTANYTYQAAELDEDKGMTWEVPEHSASAWLDYTFSEGQILTGLTIGAGIRYIGQKELYSKFASRIPSTTLVDLALKYDFGMARRELSGLEASLNVSNLFDKVFVDSCNSTSNVCWYGDRRAINAQLTYRW
ncbi:MAG: TonB-dependent siderophore receptor [Pseudochelatococcus sp.]|jgi:iron complex outermembrane receptor protein|uniref:TonB-dependent siderophore receptor n=1 Tax=Pseudochelatococcus sp. TaxID=2020869 RepID=UPI003D8CAF11